MAAHSGPNAVTENLVLSFDMGNTEKSWKGKPTTNLISNPLPNGTISGVAASGGGGTLSYDSENAAIEWVRTSYASWGAYNYVLPVFNGNLDTSSQYTISFEWKTDNIDIPDSSYNYNLVQGNGQSAAASCNLLSFSTLQDSGWYSFSYTFFPNNTGVSAYNRVIMGNKNTSVSTFYWRKIQFQQESFRTPFAVGTRSNTQAILDLTGQRSVTVQALSYNSDNTFEFDGTDDILYINYGSTLNPTVTSISISAWVKSNTTSGARMWLDAGGGNGTNQRFYSALSTSSGHGVGIQGSAWSSGSTPADTNWHYQTIVMDASANTAYVYDNSELVLTRTYTSYTFVGDIRIGGRPGYPWLGKIDAVKIYNQALTATQVKQNFAALRGRYGI
jgi:hypothetical protein